MRKIILVFPYTGYQGVYMCIPIQALALRHKFSIAEAFHSPNFRMQPKLSKMVSDYYFLPRKLWQKTTIFLSFLWIQAYTEEVHYRAPHQLTKTE